MALQYFRTVIGNETDVDGKNYAAAEPVYIRNNDGTLATIYSDALGSNEIIQDGSRNITNSRGEFTFFVETGKYLQQTGSRSIPIEVFGIDYIEDALAGEVGFITSEADRAEAAADAATISASIYEDTAAGIAATSDGEYFSVVSASGDGYLDLYKNDVGAATYQKTYPSIEKIDSVESLANALTSSRVSTAFHEASTNPELDTSTGILSWSAGITIPSTGIYSDNGSPFNRVKIVSGSIDLSSYVNGFWQAVINISNIPSSKSAGISVADIEIKRYYEDPAISDEDYITLFTWHYGNFDAKTWPETDVDGGLSNLEGRVDTLESEVITLNSDINGLQSGVQSNSVNIESLISSGGVSAFMGTGGRPTMNMTTKTLSWSGDITIPASGKYSDTQGAFERIRILAGSLDLSAYTSGFWQALINVNNIPSSKSAGIDPADIEIKRYYEDTSILNAGYITLFTWHYGIFDRKVFPETTVTPAVPNDPNQLMIVVDGAPNGSDQRVFVYYKGGRSESNRYIKWQWQRIPNATINSDVWHTEKAWEVNIDSAGVETTIREVIVSGENDYAVKEDGKADFMGGSAHGDNETIWFYMKADGDNVDPTVSATIYASQFELVQLSQLYEEGTNKTVNFSKNYRRQKLVRGTLQQTQHDVMEKDSTINSWYHTLLCVNRPYSTSLARGNEWEIEDGNDGHPLIFEPANQAQGWGEGIQYEASSYSTKNGVNVTPRLFFQNSGLYNKFYFDLSKALEDDMVNLLTGDVIETSHTYQILTNN